MLIRRVAVIAVLTLAAIVIHECGHWLAYRLAGYPVVVTLQSVRPTTTVPPRLDHWAKAAGPMVSLAAAASLLWVSRKRGSFAWVTAAFTNATLRLFPLAMDISRALQARPPFSDEGEIAVAVFGGSAGRVIVLIGVAAIFLLLSALAVRAYHFRGRAVAKGFAVYLVTLAVGIAVVLVDEAMR